MNVRDDGSHNVQNVYVNIDLVDNGLCPDMAQDNGNAIHHLLYS